MTLRQLEKRVQFWQLQLAELGLVHWRIFIEIVEDEPSDTEFSATMNAAVASSTRYDHAFMKFRRGFLEGEEFSQRGLDETIIHELLHVLFRDHEEAVASVAETLSPREREIWEERMEHEREGVVERLARSLANVVH